MDSLTLLAATRTVVPVDESAELARRFFALYSAASELEDRERARIRMGAIVRACQDAKVWRQFCCLRNSVVER